MTKLLEWLLGVSAVVVAWGLLTFDLLGLRLPQAYRDVAWPMPMYLLLVFGCYSLATVGYRVATFNDCEEAAKELQAQIQEAKQDLQKRVEILIQRLINPGVELWPLAQLLKEMIRQRLIKVCRMAGTQASHVEHEPTRLC
ncbi:hypothetical protein AAFF_G00238060 [Aldrovandia affinis]|uniref:Dolichol-phosphate mannosyltransferase subunit 3 n=1 Tax=Aldrovandia affinis TaxID=143900 RepID=A0AAD7RE25_9TELE|nr:hypothetical protein AAFF_G00238060 [Aldrovandia affinis]